MLNSPLPHQLREFQEQQQQQQQQRHLDQEQRYYPIETSRIHGKYEKSSHDQNNMVRKQAKQRHENPLHCPYRTFQPFGILRHRTFSSSAGPRQKVVAFATALRNSVKPFLLKCHPDVASSDAAKDINLKAVQNLNAFLDRVQARTTGKTATQPIRLTKEDNEDQKFEIDFCIDLEERVKGKIVHISCRRKVELLLPKYAKNTMDGKEDDDDFRHKIQIQLMRLLKAADLKVPMEAFTMNGTSDDDYTANSNGLEQAWAEVLDGDDNPMLRRRHARFTAETKRRQQYERSKEAYVSRINWTQYQKVYQQTLQDIQADVATRGLIRDHPQRRKAFVASILSHVRVSDDAAADLDDEYSSVNHLEQLIALRRLSLLLDEHFDDLHLEDLGKLWETMVLVLGPSRHYNTSSSAQAKRRKKRGQQRQPTRHQESPHDSKTTDDEAATDLLDGFAFTLHNDNRVTIQIPIDFQDQELIHQLKRNVEDFYALTHDETMGGIFPPTSM